MCSHTGYLLELAFLPIFFPINFERPVHAYSYNLHIYDIYILYSTYKIHVLSLYTHIYAYIHVYAKARSYIYEYIYIF
jgi:hypothetical protein